MPSFGKKSLERLETCDPRLQEVLLEAIKHYDFSIVSGHRSLEEQATLYAQGRETPGPIVTWSKPGQSKHNQYPSPAVDVAPYPIDWNDERAFCMLAGFIMGVAASKGIKLRWGGDWNQNGKTDDERKTDFPHLELVP